jgi:hypothetical protein
MLLVSSLAGDINIYNQKEGNFEILLSTNAGQLCSPISNLQKDATFYIAVSHNDSIDILEVKEDGFENIFDIPLSTPLYSPAMLFDSGKENELFQVAFKDGMNCIYIVHCYDDFTYDIEKLTEIKTFSNYISFEKNLDFSDFNNLQIISPLTQGHFPK